MSDARSARAGRPRRRSEPPGALSLLAGAALLALVGFGAGVVAGVVLEEPGLLLAHLAGRSREVPVDVAAGPPPGEAAPDSGPTAAGQPPRREGRVPPRQTGAAAAAAPAAHAASGIAIQVGAFGEAAAAERLALRLRERGFPVYVVAAEPAGPWRVRVGPFADRPEAERLAARLEREERLPTWILSQEAQ